MFDTGFFAIIQGFKVTTSVFRSDDDSYDRLSNHYSVILLVVFMILVGAKQYVGDPLKCWVPAQFSGYWEGYADGYCWVKNTYWVAQDSDLPTKDLRKQEEIGYYQWVPFMLAIMALLFYLPSLIWRLMHWSAGVNVQSLVTKACDASSVDPSARNDTITMLARYIEDSLMVIDESKSNFSMRVKRALFCLCGTRRMGNYLTSLYLVVKLLYIANIVGQFFLLNEFLGTDYKLYGVQMLRDLANGVEWTESGHFPRITMCDFSIRTLGNRHNYTVQCVLMINLFNEKIFIFLWFWFFILAIATIVSLFYWIYRMTSSAERYRFVKHYLKISRTYDNDRHYQILRNFVDNKLRTDGVFLLRLINLNAGDIVTTDLVTDLWARYRASRNPSQLRDDEKEDEEVMV